MSAIANAMQSLSLHEAELCLVGGIDSYLDPTCLQALLDDKQLHCARTRDGYTPGEGAGFILIASERGRRALRLPSLGKLRGAHVSLEPYLHHRDEVTRADGLVEAVMTACSQLELPDESPGMVFCDINGQRFRSEEWGLTLLRCAELRTTDYYTAAGNWGDVGAASAPLLSILACRSWARGYARDARALIWCASNQGERGAVLLEDPGTPSQSNSWM